MHDARDFIPESTKLRRNIINRSVLITFFTFFSLIFGIFIHFLVENIKKVVKN